MPTSLAADVARDALVHSLSLQVARRLPQAGFVPPALWGRAAFRMSMAGEELPARPTGSDCRFPPTDEDWQNGEENGRWWLWEALLRPLGLLRKYGQGH